MRPRRARCCNLQVRFGLSGPFVDQMTTASSRFQPATFFLPVKGRGRGADTSYLQTVWYVCAKEPLFMGKMVCN